MPRVKKHKISLSDSEIERVLAGLKLLRSVISTATTLKAEWTKQQLLTTYNRIRKQWMESRLRQSIKGTKDISEPDTRENQYMQRAIQARELHVGASQKRKRTTANSEDTRVV